MTVTIASLPILISWGLPLSLMTLIGNFIFTPLLTVFLITSALIFTTELLSIPNGFLISLLVSIRFIWEYILSLGSKCWLVGFAQPTKTVLFLTSIFIILCILRFVCNVLSKIVLLGIIISLFATITGYYFSNPQKILSHYITSKGIVEDTFNRTPDKTLIIRRFPKTRNNAAYIEIIDTGFLSRKRSPEKFVTFTLKPHIIKQYGIQTIERVVLHKPTGRSFKAIQILHKTFHINNIEIAYFQKALSNYSWRCLFELKEQLEEDGTVWKRFIPDTTNYESQT